MNLFKKWHNRKQENLLQPRLTSLISRRTQFKGNTINLYTTHDEETERIVLDNTYYGGTVSQQYDIKNKETNIRYNINLDSPQWLVAKLEDLHLMRWDNNPKPFSCPFILIEGTDMSISFTEYTYDISLTKHLPGLQFQGNIDCIRELNNLRYKLRNARNILKNNDVKDILNILQEDNIEELKKIHSTDDSVRMNIYLNDFFQLN